MRAGVSVRGAGLLDAAAAHTRAPACPATATRECGSEAPDLTAAAPGPSMGVTSAPRVRQERQCGAEPAALVAVALGPRSDSSVSKVLWPAEEQISRECEAVC
jgi:hypothetical protein